MTEKSYYPAIAKYFLKNPVTRTVVWEAKITKTNSLPYKSLMPHQEENMLQAERILTHKIADVGRLKKPFDGIVMIGARPVVIAIFYKPRGTKIYMIPLRAFIFLRETSKRKSLSIKEASLIGEEICHVK